MADQWQELKKTIVEIRDNNEFEHEDVTLMCRFLVNYMEMLEKQMQEPCGDAISRQAVLDMMQMRMSGKELYKAVYDLPPVNPQPCGDLISRKAILEEFENDQYHLEFCKEHHIERSISMEMVRIRLHDLPPVTPQSKTGHWIQTNEFFINQDGQFIYKFICSECKSLSYFRKSNKKAIGANVCPNCGARMIEPQAESEIDEIIFNNLCNSCSNIGCEFQSGIVRTECAFYMPPHIEPDNCGNYIVMHQQS